MHCSVVTRCVRCSKYVIYFTDGVTRERERLKAGSDSQQGNGEVDNY